MSRKQLPRIVRKQLQESLIEMFKSNPDISYAEIGRVCGVKPWAVSRWVYGESSIDVEHIPVICDYFGISINEFFGRPDTATLTQEQKDLLKAFDSCTEQGKALIFDQVLTAAKHFPQNPRNDGMQLDGERMQDIRFSGAASA